MAGSQRHGEVAEAWRGRRGMTGSQRHSKALRLISSAQHAGRYPTQVLGFCMKKWVHYGIERDTQCVQH